MFQTISLVFLAFVGLVAAQSRHGLQPPADPFADPKHDVFNPLRYIASDALSGMGVALTLALALGQTFWSIKYRTKFMLAMVIAAYTYALGIAIRFGLSRHPDSSGLYIVEYLFVTLSPCGFIAAEYVLLGRLSRSLGGDKHMLISPQRITLVFVISDISTFLVQAAGGGISASAHEDLNKAKAGSNVFLVGLALQLASFCFFMILYLRFIIRMYKYEKETWVRDAHLPWYKDWRALAGAFTVSCIGVLVRSVYRTVELSEGFGGYLSRTEVFFYVLDFVPLIIALLAYIPFWPGRFITNSAARGISPDSSVESTDPEKGDKVQETVRTHSAEGAETLSGNLEGEKEH